MVLLTCLHFLEPEIDPTRRFISEYALGKYGFLMSVAFCFWSLSHLFLFVALRNQLKTSVGKIGLFFLLVSALGLIIAGIFTTDPAIAETQTIHGNLHNLGGTLGMAIPFASLFIGIALFKNPAYSFAKKTIILATFFTILGFLVSAISLGYLFSQNNGKLNLTMWVGLPTRFEVLTYCIWLLTITTVTKKTLIKNTKDKTMNH